MKHALPLGILSLALIAATASGPQNAPQQNAPQQNAPQQNAPQQKEDLYSIPTKSKYSLQSFANKKPLTRAERTNFTETSRYEDVGIFIDSVIALGGKVHKASMGKTALGRELWYVIASRPLITSPAEARRLGRPIAYIQGNIHAGEVEG